MKRRDLTGLRFGRLTVVGRQPAKNKRTYWTCVCDCGQKTETSTNHLTSGNTKSCGCLHDEVAAERQYKHGGKGTRLYNIWKNARQRCRNANNPDYNKWYGARGVNFAEEWDDYKRFHEWAIANGYTDELTLDRINPDGDYSPENCRWATWKEQRHNQRRSKGVI